MGETIAIALVLCPFVLGYLLARCRRGGNVTKAELERVRGERLTLEKDLVETRARLEAAEFRAEEASAVATRLAPYTKVADADDEARKIFERVKHSAAAFVASAKAQAETMQAEASDRLREARATAGDIEAQANAQAQAWLTRARTDSETVLAAAREKANEAMSLVGRESEVRAIIAALENRLKGYGDSYIQPGVLLLEGLAESYGSASAAIELKAARAQTRLLLQEGRAAQCDYVESNRRETAVRFVAEAFNGAVDSVLARAKVDNVGKLTKEIEDAAAIVNFHGSAFRNARVTPEYVAARRAELIAAARFQELLKREQEEQRAIRERIREEARAQREFEAAQKAAAREEDRVRKALAEAQLKFDSAAAEDRAKMEERLQTLQSALADAEAKSVRALSMAQQTRAGHCYVISNEGSFGEEVLKIGMTRRLDPLDRVAESALVVQMVPSDSQCGQRSLIRGSSK